jgi:hypothetical protein
MALGHHRHQRPLCSLSRLDQPTRVVAALAQLRDRQIDRTRSGVELAGPIAVAAVCALRRHLAIPGIAQHLHLGARQPLGERANHLTQ